MTFRFLRAAHLQNETAPETCLMHRYEKWFEKREEGSEKRSQTCPKNLSPSNTASNILTGTFLRVFHHPKFAHLFFHREALQG